MKVAIVNYGMGNIGSVRRALSDLGAEVLIAEHPAALFDANRIVLPGVGAFAEGMARMEAGGWTTALKHLVGEGRSLLGICLGMQMLADSGDESGESAGLGFVPGRVRRLDALGCELRIPHVGWNDISATASDDPLFAHVPPHSDFYFVHSYGLACERSENVSATIDYGVHIAAAVRHGNVFGTQFHPEKSSRAGRQILRNFLDYVPC